MKKSTLVRLDQIEKIEAAMNAAPRLELPLRADDALKKMAPAMRSMRLRGYTLEQIRDTLSEHGVVVSVAAIKRAAFQSPTHSRAKKARTDVRNETQS